MSLSLDDVLAARARIAGGIQRTPSTVSRTLSEITGATVILKFENLQFTASFKERGALNRLLTIDRATCAGVVAMSAGNHALGVAYHASRLGIPATIVMPAPTPFVKVSRTRDHGARVVLHGDDLASAAVEAHRMAAAEGLTFVHPFDDPMVIAGQGTVALELLEDHPSLTDVIVPVGGGGLLAGMALAIGDRVRLWGVESELYPTMSSPGSVPGGESIAEGIAVVAPGTLTEPIVRERAAGMLVVPETDIEAAIGTLIEVEKTVVEGAGAAGLAALLTNRALFAGRTVGLILSGGNIDARVLASVLLRALVRAGRLVTLQVSVGDHPGMLARLTAIVAAAGANVVDVRHSRLLTELSIRTTRVELVIEVAEAAQADETLAALRAAGFEADRVDEL